MGYVRKWNIIKVDARTGTDTNTGLVEVSALLPCHVCKAVLSKKIFRKVGLLHIYTLLYCQMQECVIPDKETHEERA